MADQIPFKDQLTVNPKQRCALLIGIETYDDERLEDKQLFAGRNDVLAFWKVCRRLKMRPENIVCLTSPMLDIEDFIWAEQELSEELHDGQSNEKIDYIVRGWFLEGERPKVARGLATLENMKEAVKWLATDRVDRKKNELPVDRIVTYSGHGTTMEESGTTVLALCPSDLVLGNNDTYLKTTWLKGQLEGVDDNMTVMLDCCFAQNAEMAKPRGTHRVSTLASGATDSSFDVSGLGARVFCASGPKESSYQAILGGYWYSAFTWAVTVALEQWQIVDKHSTISHAELLFRARTLLEALSFPQHPVLLDHLGTKAVFGRGEEDEVTSAEPNQERRKGQVDPSTKCAVTCLRLTDLGDGKPILDIVIPGIKYSGTKFTIGSEYWYLSRDQYSSEGRNIKIEFIPYDENAYSDRQARVYNEKPNWQDAAINPNVTGEYSNDASGTSVRFGLTATITLHNNVPTPMITWFHALKSNVAAFLNTQIVVGKDNPSWTLSTYSSTGAKWFLAM